MKKYVGQIISAGILLCILVGMLPIPMVSAVSSGGVQSALNEVLSDFPVGSYFTTDGRQSSNGELTAVMKARGLSTSGYDKSYTCVAFAKYVWAKVFNHNITVQRTQISMGRAGVADTWKNAKIGDLVYFYKNSDCSVHTGASYVYDPYVHAAIVWELSSTSVTLYDCNQKGANKIGLYTVSFGSSGWPKSYCRVYRANNYDAVNGSTTTSTPADNKPNTNNPTTYSNCNVRIDCVNGQTVNLYNNPGDTSRVTYFNKGQVATSTYSATLSDGSVWYRITANDKGTDKTFWLKYESSKMTVTPNATTYTVTFNPVGGSVPTFSMKVTNGSTYGSLPTPTKNGYTFDGWYTAQTGGNRITGSTSVNLTGNQTLYAHWIENPIKYTITFDANGGSVSPSTKTYTAGSLIGSLPIPSRDGYIFQHWHTAKSGSGMVVTADNYTVSENATLYARWVADGSETVTDKSSPQVYTVTFDPLGVGLTTYSKTVTNGSTYGALPTPPTIKGYTFDGWYTAKSGGTKITESTKVNLTGNQKLYAHWSQMQTNEPESEVTDSHDAHVKDAGTKKTNDAHPHYVYYKCRVCGEWFTDYETSELDSCQICNPPKEPTWSDWSEWSTERVYSSPTRKVQSREVEVTPAHTEYRYGRYVDSTGTHDCWCAKYLEGLSYIFGKASLQYSEWSTTQYRTSGKDWSCGTCSGNHTGVDHTTSDGRSWWNEYVLPNGSYYWRETRQVAGKYEIQYRYSDLISG